MGNMLNMLDKLNMLVMVDTVVMVDSVKLVSMIMKPINQYNLNSHSPTKLTKPKKIP